MINALEASMKIKPKERSRQSESKDLRSRYSIIRRTSAAVAMACMPFVALAQSDTTGSSVSSALQSLVVPSILVLIALIAINAFFVAGETALELLRPSHIKTATDEKNQAILQRLLDRRPQCVAGCTLVRQTALWWIVMVSFVPAAAITQRLAAAGSISLTATSYLVTWFIIALPVALVNMIFAEIVPKTAASVRPVAIATRTARAMHTAATIFRLPGSLVTSLATLMTRRFGTKASFIVTNQAEEEIKSLADTAQASGEIEKEERELLHSVFEFTDTLAREIMTPRVDMDAMDLRSSPADIIKVIKTTGRSRIPLYEDTDDQIVGIIHAKDLLGTNWTENQAVNLRTLLRPVVFVPENKNIRDLLEELRRSRSQMAIVQDEYGGTAGLVTIEDIVEELVGEIVDEYDDEVPDVVRNGSGWIVQGRTNLYDLGETLGVNLDSEEFDTVGGYVFGLFGRQPREGESIVEHGVRFVVEKTDGRRIERLHVDGPTSDSEFTGEENRAV